MRKILFLMMMSLICMVVHAQQRFVSGTVTDSSGEPLPGVNVVIRGTEKGTITDTNGKFTISVTGSEEILSFSFIGFKPVDLVVSGKSEVMVTMKEETVGLDEVVAIGYGTVRKVNLTGAVEAIKGTEVRMKPTAQASSALVGMIPGLTAIQSSGQPGDDQAQLIIRGIGSLSASNSPLVLIDGIEGDINRINPQDIEDISVLKDAASAAVYGSRSSNGVILITTKRAKQKGVQFKYSNYFGWQSTDYPEFVDAPSYMKYMGSYSDAQIEAYREGMKNDPDLYPNTNWTKELFSEPGYMQNHDIGLSSSSEFLDMAASLSYVKQKGNIPNFGYSRINGRINSDFKLNNRLTMSLDVSFYKSLREFPTWLTTGTIAGALSRTVHQAYRLAAIYPVFYSDGSYGDGFTGMNPVAMARDGGISSLDEKNFRATLKAVYKPVDDLTLTILYAPDLLESNNHMHQRQYTTIMDWTKKTTRLYPNENGLKEISADSKTQSFNALANYSKKLDDHYFGALAGMEVITYKYKTFNAFRKNFILIDYDILDAGSSEGQTLGGTATEWALMSFFGRINYSYKDRYLLEGTLRRDGSSRFYKDNRWAYFPSISGAWRISQESFMKSFPVFSDLKIRASWGRLGNQTLKGNFPYTSEVVLGQQNYMFNSKIVTGAAQTVMANQNLKWETSETTNIGLDIAFLNNRLAFSGNWFVRYTRDLLVELPITSVVGLTPSYQNAAEVKNDGWELTSGWNDHIGDFRYTVKFNISDVHNKVMNLSNVGPIINGSIITQEGSAIGLLYGYQANGIYQTDAEAATGPQISGLTLKAGDVRLVNQNPDVDNMINNLDRVVIGDPFPRFSYGLNFGSFWHGIDFSIYFDGVGKRNVLLTGDLVQPLVNNGNVSLWYEKNAWSDANTQGKYPRITTLNQGNNLATSTLWVFNASYFRLRNLTIGYSVPETLVKSRILNNLRIYFTGMNIFTSSNLPSGVDPTVPNDNNGGDIYPITSTYTFGLELKF
jgi:TonB-linked SusC/RagA family outer membrane protein